jgi:hypothetical protein
MRGAARLTSWRSGTLRRAAVPIVRRRSTESIRETIKVWHDETTVLLDELGCCTGIRETNNRLLQRGRLQANKGIRIEQPLPPEVPPGLPSSDLREAEQILVAVNAEVGVAKAQFFPQIVPPEERSAAGGFAGVARATGAALSPLFVGFLFAKPSLINAPFFIAGTLKIVYDLLLYYSFRKIRPPEERQ